MQELAQIVYGQLRLLQLEPPTRGRLTKLIQTAFYQYELSVFESTAARLTDEAKTNLAKLIDNRGDLTDEEDEETASSLMLHELKTGTGAAKVRNIRRVAERLSYLQKLALPDDLFHSLSPRYLSHLAQRASVESVSHLQRHANSEQTLTLLAAFCWVRQRRITDQLVTLLIRVLNDIRLRAKQRVERTLLQDYIRVGGKQQLLFKLAETMWDNPDGVIRDVLYPIIGTKRLEQLVAESKQTGGYHRSVQTRIGGSYTHHYRPILPILMDVLQFQSNNKRHQPLIEALHLIAIYMEESDPYYPEGEHIPLEDAVLKQWQSWVFQKDGVGKRRVRRVRYELCVLQTLRERIRAREIWITGSDQYRNPDEDVPKDFTEKRDLYLAELSLPTQATSFVNSLKAQLVEALTQFNANVTTNPAVEILPKAGGWIKLSPLQKQDDPRQLRRLDTWTDESSHIWNIASRHLN